MFGTETCSRNAQPPVGRNNNNKTVFHNSNKIFLAKEKHGRCRQNGLFPERRSESVAMKRRAKHRRRRRRDAGRQAGKQATPCAPNPNSRSSKNVEISNSSPLDETMEGARVNTLRDGWIDGWVDRKTIFSLAKPMP